MKKIQGQEIYDGLDPDIRQKLEIYRDELIRWRGRVNLIGSGTWQSLWETHFLDSLRLVPLLPEIKGAVDIVDLGSGGGFPGLVVALATNRAVDLIESRRAKGEFLHEVVRKTGALARVHVDRINNVELPGTARVITARALTSLGRLLEMAARLGDQDTICLFPKGSDLDEEIDHARAEWQMDLEVLPAERGVVLRIGALKRKIK